MNPTKTLFVPLAALALFAASTAALAQGKSAAVPKSGEQVFKQVCTACHTTGVAHAPKVGDRQAWAPLIAEGQAVLTAHAWVGVRAMPAQGGAPELSLEEFARAVAWIASESGGDWKDPDAALMHRIRLEAMKRLDSDILAKQKLKRQLRATDARATAR